MCDLLRPVRQPAAGAGDDGHSGTGDLPGLVPSICRAAAQTTRSGDPHKDSNKSQFSEFLFGLFLKRTKSN